MASRSGIPYVSEEAAPPDLVDLIRARRGGELLNLDRILLHSPKLASAWNSYAGVIRAHLSLPGKLRELSIMAIGVLNGSEYEWAQHEGEFLKAGGTRQQLAALKNTQGAEKDENLFDESERATLAFTREMTRDIKVTAATMKRVRAFLPDQQVVELAGIIGWYNNVSRLLIAIGVELEGDPARRRA